MKRFLATISFASAALLTAACGSSDSSDGTSSPSASTDSSSVVTPARPGVVDLSHFGSTCDAPVRCVLPLQFSNMDAPGESVAKLGTSSGTGGWPLDGDKVTILCQIPGQVRSNRDGTSSGTWYGIMVPQNKVTAHPAHTLPSEPYRTSVHGRHTMKIAGYVNALWVRYTGDVKSDMSPCTSSTLNKHN